MNTTHRRWILRLHSAFLVPPALGGLITDLVGAFLGRGPQSAVLGSAPHTAIGFVEAHGLAFVLAMLLWRAGPSRSWHAAGAAIGLLLGTSNLLFWGIFEAADMMAMGYATTTLHFTFATLQIAALLGSSRDAVACGRPAQAL